MNMFTRRVRAHLAATDTPRSRAPHALPDPCIAEPLEPRRLLAVNVGVVDFASGFFSSAWDSHVEVEKGVYENGILRRPDGLLTELMPLTFRDEGRFQLDRLEWGFNGYGHAGHGAQFLPEHGFAGGWFAGAFFGSQNEATTRELILLVPLAANGTNISVLAGAWEFSTRTVPASDAASGIGAGAISGTAALGSFTIGSNPHRIDWDARLGDAPAATSMISNWDGHSFRTDGSLSFMLSADGQTLIFGETDFTNNTVMIGVATRALATPEMESVAGTYLGFLRAVQTPVEQVGIERPIEISIILNLGGTYEITGITSLWSGGESGTWTIDGTQIVLTSQDSTIERRFTLGANGGTLIGGSVTEGGEEAAAFAYATRRVTTDDVPQQPILTIPWLDENGNPIALIDRANEAWRVAEVASLSGGPAVTGDLVTWFDPITNEAHGAGVSAEGVVVFRELSLGTWTYIVLADELAGDVLVTRSLTTTIASGHQINLFGLTDGGELIRYFTRPRAATEIVWAMQNLSATELPRNGDETPAYAGDLVAYATSWGGLNVAGLDDVGRVWTVWWAPQSGGWRSSNISMLTQSARFSGPIDVTLTQWRGINITGVNSLGEVVTNWWAPALGDTWVKSNLTRNTDKPLLEEALFSSAYRGRDATITMVGIERDTGNIMLYWWQRMAPGNQDMWRVIDITGAARATESHRIVEALTAQITPEGDLNIIGRNADGQLVRYWTEVRTSAGAWLVETIDL